MGRGRLGRQRRQASTQEWRRRSGRCSSPRRGAHGACDRPGACRVVRHAHQANPFGSPGSRRSKILQCRVQASENCGRGGRSVFHELRPSADAAAQNNRHGCCQWWHADADANRERIWTMKPIESRRLPTIAFPYLEDHHVIHARMQPMYPGCPHKHFLGTFSQEIVH